MKTKVNGTMPSDFAYAGKLGLLCYLGATKFNIYEIYLIY